MQSFKDSLKMIIKKELQPTISNSLEKNTRVLTVEIQKLVNEITEWIWDKAIFEKVRNASIDKLSDDRANAVIEKVYSDAVIYIRPKIDEMTSVIRTMIIEATGEAIKELLQEEVKKRIDA